MKPMKFLNALFAAGSCPDCGWLFACDACAKRMDYVDEDIDLRQEEKEQNKK